MCTKMSRRCCALLLAIALAGAMAMAPPALAQAQCGERVSALGFHGPSKANARRYARVAWMAKVHGNLGEDSASWRNAKARRIVCKRVRGRIHICLAAAMPCRVTWLPAL
jgi:hypothetical protein